MTPPPRQVVYSKLKIRQLQGAMGGGAGGTMDNSLSNSMMGGGLGVQVGSAKLFLTDGILIFVLQAASSAGSGQSFGHKNYDLVYGIIRGSMEEQGVDRDHVHSQVGTINIPVFGQSIQLSGHALLVELGACRLLNLVA